MKSLPMKYWRYGIRPAVFLAGLVPAAWLVLQWWFAYSGGDHGLGFNPFEYTNRFTGDWAIRILLASLTITPVIIITRVKRLVMLRRMIGLFAFFYVLLHIVSYLVLDLEMNVSAFIDDIIKRNYITVGMTAFVLLIPLAATSYSKAIKYLGAKRWQQIHKAAYVAGVLAVFHFFMMRKGFQMEPVWYGVWLGVGFAIRYYDKRRKVVRASSPGL